MLQLRTRLIICISKCTVYWKSGNYLVYFLQYMTVSLVFDPSAPSSLPHPGNEKHKTSWWKFLKFDSTDPIKWSLSIEFVKDQWTAAVLFPKFVLGLGCCALVTLTIKTKVAILFVIDVVSIYTSSVTYFDLGLLFSFLMFKL